jgi:hypothetical protein
MFETSMKRDTNHTASTSPKLTNLSQRKNSERVMQDDASKEGNDASTAIVRLPT